MGHPIGPSSSLIADVARLEAAIEAWELSREPPHPDPVRLARLADHLRRLARAATRASEGETAPVPAARPLLGESAAMQEILRTIRRIGPRSSHILIQGESGTGKELAARAVHGAGPRSAARFVPVDCGCLTDSLLESELFGHRRGAFTGALADRVGLVEEADGGTLFLDEMANASPAVQLRLLRLLQEGEIRRVGDNQARRVNVRIIGATNGDLRQLVAAGRFREDLYYRLDVIRLDLPPLRRRREDIPQLVAHFLDRFCERHGLAPKRLAPAALEILLRYPWPGNVRELENVIERAVLLGPGAEIGPDVLPPALLDALLESTSDPACGGAAKNGEHRLIERALLESGGDKTRAARLIGWHKTKLYRRLARYGIPGDFGRASGRSSAPRAVPAFPSSPDRS
jgi:two-component system, NtrC family, response regulator HydG